ncbi:MAG: hypothetical protein WKF77_07320 [Planctomycetaceae bacterium]
MSQFILRFLHNVACGWLRTGLSGRLLRFVVLTALFCVVSIWSVWPMPRQIASQIPTSQSGIATVPLFNAWTIAWNAHCAARGMKGYWDAPIFHPLKEMLALSEPQPATLVVAPAIWWLRSPALAYNVYLLLSLTLNGLFTVLLMRTLRAGWIASIVAGVAMIQHPVMHLQIDVVQLMPVWGILWTLAALVRLREAAIRWPSEITTTPPENAAWPSLRTWRSIMLRGGETALAFAAVFAVSAHHGLFLSLLLAATGLLLVPWRHFFRWLPGAVLASLIAVGLLLPLLLPIARVMREHSFERSESLVAQLSIKPIDYLVEPDTALIKCHLVAREGRWHMSTGWMRMVLAFGAMCVSFLPQYRSRSVETWFLLAVAIMAFLLSLGVNLQVGGWNIWMTLSQYVPGFSQVRSAFRFAYFVQIVVIVLSATGLDWLWNIFFRHGRPGRLLSHWICGVVFVTLGLLTMFEIPPPAVQLVGVPGLRDAEWKSFVRSNLKDSYGVLLMPYVNGATVRDFDVTARWMLSHVLDDIPMLNGYSGFFPESHFRLQKAIDADPYSDETLRLLYEAKIQFVIVHGHSAHQFSQDPGRKFSLYTVFKESAGIQVLELRPRVE